MKGSFIKNGNVYIRRLDLFIEATKTAVEVKSGFVKLTKFVKDQIIKDVELRRLGKIDEIVWRFFKSDATKLSGPSKDVFDLLKENGIKVLDAAGNEIIM